MRRAAARAWRVQPAWPISLGVAATAFSGHWDRVGLPLPVDRILLIAGFGLALLRAGRAPDLPPLRFRPIHWLLLLVLCYGVVSAYWVGTLDEHTARYALIDRLGLVPFVGFFVGPVAFSTPAQRRILMSVLVVLGAYLGATAILESVKAHGLVWPSYILDPTYGIHSNRARGPFVEAEADGLSMIICGVAAAISLAHWRHRAARLAAWAVMGLCAAGAVLTYTRLVWIGAGAGVLVALAVFPPLRWRLLPVTVMAAGGMAIAIAVVPGLGHSLSKRYHEQMPIWTRRSTNDAALRMVDAKPVLGWGWGTFARKSPDWFRTIEDIRYSGVGDDVHNTFLSRFVELGLAGGGLWLIAVLLAIGRALIRPLEGDAEIYRRGFCVIVVAMLVAAMLSPLTALLPLLMTWMWAGFLTPAPERAIARQRTAVMPAVS